MILPSLLQPRLFYLHVHREPHLNLPRSEIMFKKGLIHLLERGARSWSLIQQSYGDDIINLTPQRANNTANDLTRFRLHTFLTFFPRPANCSRQFTPNGTIFALRAFALIVSAHPYCARKFKRHVMHERWR